jgi:hypothetical protein
MNAGGKFHQHAVTTRYVEMSPQYCGEIKAVRSLLRSKPRVAHVNIVK